MRDVWEIDAWRVESSLVCLGLQWELSRFKYPEEGADVFSNEVVRLKEIAKVDEGSMN